jgi:hypothetical protein
MDEFIEKVYLQELIQQCQYAIDAVDQMNECLKNKNPGEFFREAGDFLQHSSAVSRILWPPGNTNRIKKKRAKHRGTYLKATLTIADGHTLQTRSLRDHFEHFDERLDEWAETSIHKNIVDNMISPRSAIGNVVKDDEIMRMYDPAKKEIVFRGETFNVQALVDGVKDVQAKAKTRLQVVEANKRLQPTGRADGAPGD